MSGIVFALYPFSPGRSRCGVHPPRFEALVCYGRVLREGALLVPSIFLFSRSVDRSFHTGRSPYLRDPLRLDLSRLPRIGLGLALRSSFFSVFAPNSGFFSAYLSFGKSPIAAAPSALLSSWERALPFFSFYPQGPLPGS